MAGDGSLTAAEAARLRRYDPHAPALAYYSSGRRVAAELSRNGGSMDALLRR